MELPPELMRFGKSIDALVVADERLIAVDDIVLPKWLLVYDLSQGGVPPLVSTVQLPNHGKFESVLGSALGTEYIAVISSGSGFVSLLDRTTLEERWVLFMKPPPPPPLDGGIRVTGFTALGGLQGSNATWIPVAPMGWATNVAFRGETLLIGTDDGVIEVTLESVLSWRPNDGPITVRWRPSLHVVVRRIHVLDDSDALIVVGPSKSSPEWRTRSRWIWDLLHENDQP